MQELKEEDISRLKGIELGILKSFISVCDRLNLVYFAVGGTLLGTIRHKGFIPWDDDIDVAMPRKDYDIFIAKAQALLPDDLFLQNIYTEKNWFSNYAKIRKNNTLFVESSIKERKINHGVFIDVFPLDYYPEDRLKQLIVDTKLRIINRRLSDGYIKDHKENTSVQARIVKTVTRMLWPDLKKVSYMKEKLITTVPESKYVIVYCGAWGKREIAKRKWFDKIIKKQFEDININVPKKYNKYLNRVYGDYMKLPPIEERKGHHFVDSFDF